MPEIQIFKFKNNQPRLDIDAAGYPCLFAVTLDGHTAVRVTKGGLQSIKREISRALRDAKEADDARR